jgi:hypothetical protein
VGLLALLSSGFLAAAQPSWRQLTLDLPVEAAGLEGAGDETSAIHGLIATLGDQTQCRVGKRVGIKGLVATADAGVGGAFLALWWDQAGELTATVRTADSRSMESFTLRDGKQTELILVRRANTIYAYAEESGMLDPLIAVDFPVGSAVAAGALVEKGSDGLEPSIGAVVAAPTLTGDVLLNQPATRLTGDWISEDDPGSLGGSHLLNRGDDSNASVAVRIENLLPGAHELWIRYAAAQSHTVRAEVSVEGFGKPVSLLVNQRICGGLWLPLGRFETQFVTFAAIRLAPGEPGSGSLSIDAVHAVWSAWADENHDQQPDALESTNARNPLVDHPASVSGSAGSDGNEDSARIGSFTQAGMEMTPAVDASKAVVFVHATLGDDSFDGRLDKPQAGAWFSVRGGPKRSIGAALKSVSKATRVIELHLDGKLEPPPGGFQNLGNVGLVLVPGLNGASFEKSGLPPDLQQPLIPSPPVRP